MTSEPPRCPGCHRPLDRIDHHAIEHSLLDGEVYRPVGTYDGDAHGGEMGLASEVDLRCGYCYTSITRAGREFFYRRWEQLLEFRQRAGLDAPAGNVREKEKGDE